MANIDSGSIDCIITDPPYYSTSLTFDKADRIDFKEWLIECSRILKPDGVLISFADFNLLSELRSLSPFKNTYELIWKKTMPVGFLEANFRPLRSHEFIGVFTNKLKKSTYNPQKTKGIEYKKKRTGEEADHYNNARRTGTVNNGDRHPVSVLEFSNGNIGSMHPTQKPVDLIAWLLRTYTNEGNIIFDPFMGSGTTGVAAAILNRNFIGCEIDSTYFAIAKARIEDAEHNLINFFGCTEG